MAKEKAKITSLSGDTKVRTIELGSSVKSGQVISLNMKRRQYFRVPGFVLAPDKPTETIPTNIGNQSLTMIENGLRDGHLILGTVHVPYLTKDPDLMARYVDALDNIRDIKKDLHPYIQELARSNLKLGGYTKHEILEEMLIAESNGRCRDKVLEYLHYAMEKIPGHSKVRDYAVPQKRARSSATPTPPTISEQGRREALEEI